MSEELDWRGASEDEWICETCFVDFESYFKWTSLAPA
jgi:hypothetical protein